MHVISFIQNNLKDSKQIALQKGENSESNSKDTVIKEIQENN